MGPTVCLGANCLGYPQGGGHLWVFLNWALGLRACGCRVVWLEVLSPDASPDAAAGWVAALAGQLGRYGLADTLAVVPAAGDALPAGVRGPLGWADVTGADLLLNLKYRTPAAVVERFRRTALVDIDPGLLQLWMTEGQLAVPRHDVYFSTGETVGRPGALFPDAGIAWHYTPPCVALDHWPVTTAPPAAPFTTVTQWFMEDWVVTGGGYYRNDKREGFLPFLDLPGRTRQPLELAMPPQGGGDETARLTALGWRVRDAYAVAAAPWDYQAYVRGSRGEFSCVKPSCVRLQNAWVSDRTLCYLASGRPAVVRHTGPSRFLPDAAGLFRFHTVEEAAAQLDAVAADHDRQSRLARALAEEFFDARRVVGKVLERALA
jgi:hypothetical protein